MGLNKILITKVLFILFSLTAIIGFLVEVYTFKHFLFKHVLISVEVLAIFSILTGLFVLNRKIKVKRNIDILVKVVLYINLYISIPLTILYFYLTYLNQSNFSNFVFSKYHLQPLLLIRPIIFSVCFLIIIHLRAHLPEIMTNFVNLKSKKSKSELSLVLLLILLLSVYFINNFLTDVSTLGPYVAATVKNINSTKEERYDYMMNMKYGSFYDYIKFIKSVTSDSSSILLPPQKNPWQYEGNQRLTRFFLHPRVLYSAHEKTLPDRTDYVLIAWGRPEFSPLEGGNYGWPDYPIEAEKVFIFDGQTNNLRIYEENYDPMKFLTEGVYGIIKTK